MNILFLNASPKKKRSNSGVFANIVKMLLFPHKSKTIRIPTSSSYDEILACFKEIDCLVIASPVYVDTLPSHLLKFLSKAESFCKENNLNFKVYALFNCGFIEGKQCKNAFSVLKCWCKKTGVSYSGGVGIGGGEMMGVLPIIIFLAVLIPLIKMIIGIFYTPVEYLSLSTVVASFDWRYMVNSLLVYLVLNFGMLVSLFRLRLRIPQERSIKEIYTGPTLFPKTLFIIIANIFWVIKATFKGTCIYRIYKQEKI
ncbi:MAG: hypothetical protein LBI82_05870 [Dysgonamonadaceae bacterium]|jgi:hypothetical protein|nr:hypothetical protein [Dysgonamonadaceae bacterium]